MTRLVGASFSRPTPYERWLVSISRTVEWRKGGWQFADTKRPRSRRLVKVHGWVVALMREGKSKYQDDCRIELVFRAKCGGPIRESRFVQRYFKPLLQAAELSAIRLYELRHTAAISLAAGVPPKVVS